MVASANTNGMEGVLLNLGAFPARDVPLRLWPKGQRYG